MSTCMILLMESLNITLNLRTLVDFVSTSWANRCSSIALCKLFVD